MNKVLSNIWIVNLSLFLKKESIVIFGDIHIGFDEAMRKEGVLLPKFHFKDLIKQIDKIISKTKPKTIIINGDVKHEFGTISDEEWRNTLKLIDYLSKKAKLILIKGNHDTTLEPISNKRNLDIRDYYLVENMYICHGHKIPTDEHFKKAKKIIISHDHPALSLRDGPRIEKYKCFLIGKNNGKEIIILPAFSPTAGGSDVMKEQMMSPLIGDVSKYKIYVVENKVYDFGTIKDLKEKINPN